MQTEGKTIHMVPVTIHHERLFDIRHLATEMVSGKIKTFNSVEIVNLVSKEKNGRLGKTFLKY
jgi:glycerol-3-phosphate O-acyltransferase